MSRTRPASVRWLPLLFLAACLLASGAGCARKPPAIAGPPGGEPDLATAGPSEGVAGPPGGESVPAPAARLLLSGVQVFDVAAGSMSAPRDILIEGERIAGIFEPGTAGEAETVVDCGGKFALPGLFDCHAHLVHLLEEGEEGLARGLREFVLRGVTQVRDVGGPIDVLAGIGRRVAAGELVGPEPFYCGPMLEGSPLTWAKFNEQFPGFTVAVDTLEDAERILPELAGQGACMIKTFNLLDRNLYPGLVEVARRCGLRIVHDPGQPLLHPVPLDAALELGVTSFEHAMAPWPAVLTEELAAELGRLRAPETGDAERMAFMMKVDEAGTASVSPERLRALAARMKEKGAYLTPTLNVFASMEEMAFEQVREQMGLEEIPAPMQEMIRRSIAALQEVSRFLVAELAKEGVRMLVGQDGCVAADTFQELRRLRECGVSEAEIIRGATIYPAEWLGVDDRLGSLAAGKQANILVLAADPLQDIGNMESTFLVLQRGRVVSR